MRLSTQDKPFFPSGLEEKFRTVKSMGFEAYEIDGKLLVDRFEEVNKAAAAAGLPVVTACGGYQGWIGDFNEEKRQTAIADIGEILRRLGEISGQGIVVPAAWGMFSKRLPPMVPPRTEEEDRRVLLDSLDRLNRVAEQTGTYVYLEPLNRYEDYMINTLSDAVSLIKEGQFARVRVTADFYHMNIEERSIPGSIREHKDYIGHVHIADSHRFQPGDGHLDFASGFQALRDIEYKGFMAFECRVLGQPEDELYRQSVQYIQSCMNRV